MVEHCHGVAGVESSNLSIPTIFYPRVVSLPYLNCIGHFMSKKSQIKRRSAPESVVLTVPNPILKRIFTARGIVDDTQLDYRLAAMLKPTLYGLDAACLLLEQALRESWSILMVGDFDADGATSTAVAIRALRGMGAAKVDYLVPNRFDYGYGLSPEIVEVAAKMQPQLIITVDNGISSIAGVAKAAEYGIPVLVTDHHLPGEELPQAAVIINPNLVNDDFASKNLAGVGVVFYLLAALRSHLRECGWFVEQSLPEFNIAGLLDLVALGTVADVVALDYNNRILVDQGIKRIRSGKCVAGLSALIEVGKRNAQKLVASDLGFAVGPRLNAAGRLEDISIGIECLLTDDASRAQQLAQQLDEINHERRYIEQEMKLEAFSEMERLEAKLKQVALPAGLCLYKQDWHQGVVGILASRVKDKYHRPVIVFADEGNGMIKGSARSVQGVHIRDALEYVSSQKPGLIGKFGGHAMAAGLSMPQTNLNTFKAAFADYVQQQLGDQVGLKQVLTDGELGAGQFSMELASDIRQSGPWGQAFPEPLFDGVFKVLDKRVLKDAHLKMTLEHGSGEVFDAIAFNERGEWITSAVQHIRIAYKLDINEFRGRKSIQLMVDYLEAV